MPRTMSFKEVAELMDFVLENQSSDTWDSTAMSCIIHNEGAPEDRLEALMAMKPIYDRLQKRLAPSRVELRAKTDAIVRKYSSKPAKAKGGAK